jgi:hypothetical protein
MDAAARLSRGESRKRCGERCRKLPLTARSRRRCNFVFVGRLIENIVLNNLPLESALAAKRNKWGPRACEGEEAVYAGFALLLTAGAPRHPEGTLALGHLRFKRKALRKPGFPFRKVG